MIILYIILYKQYFAQDMIFLLLLFQTQTNPILLGFFPLRSISSVVHQHASGHNISLSGRHTVHFIRQLYLWNKDIGVIDLCGIVQREAELFALWRWSDALQQCEHFCDYYGISFLLIWGIV